MRFKRWLYNKIPPAIRASVFELFFSLLCFLAGIPLILGKASSEAVDKALPTWLIYIWGFALVAGPVLVVAGLIGIHIKSVVEGVFWRRVEAWGLSMMAYMGYLYFLAIVIANPRSVPANAIVLAFAMTCHFRVVEIQVEVDDFRRGIGVP